MEARPRRVLRLFGLFTIITDHRCIRPVHTNKLRDLVWIDLGDGVIAERVANL
jgi:hypothetical protein